MHASKLTKVVCFKTTVHVNVSAAPVSYLDSLHGTMKGIFDYVSSSKSLIWYKVSRQACQHGSMSV